MLYNLVFTNNIILSRFFFFFLNIELYFLTPAVTAEILNPITELVILIGIPSKNAKAEIEIHLVTAEPLILLTHQFVLLYFSTKYFLFHIHISI